MKGDAQRSGFAFGTTDAIRRHGQKPNKEPKIQTTSDDQQRNVGLTTEAQKRTEVGAELCQPC